MTLAFRIYRRLAQAFPHEFKLAYGTELMQLGEDVVEEISRKHGITGLVRLIADIAIHLPLEYLSEMQRDMRYGWRALLKSPGFALVGIISLGLGMGVTTSAFSTLWSQILRSLPGVTNPGELVMTLRPVSYYYIEQYREQKGLVAGVAAFQSSIPFNVTFPGDSGKPQRIFGQLVSADYFSVVGVQSQLGRVLNPELDKAGGIPAVVITDRFWRNRVNSAPDAVGQTLRLNGQPATIVGITPKDFNGVLSYISTDIFVPVTAPSALAPELGNDVLHKRDAKEFLAIIRLAPHVTLESAEAGLDTVTRHLDEQDASAPPANDKTRRITLLPGGTAVPIPREMKPVVLGFYAVLLGLIMTIACMNLANMLLARGAARRKELAIRLAIGASRFRLIRQMMSEGILISLLGGVAGFTLAYWLSVLSSRLKLPTAVPMELDRVLDWRAAVFTFILAVVCGIGFSLVPALQATKNGVIPALKDGVVLRAYRRLGIRNLLVLGQVTGSLMLLLITGFLVIGFSKTSSIRTNFNANTMYLLSVDPIRDGYSAEKTQALFEKLPQRLKTAGPVSGLALAVEPPFSVADPNMQLTAGNGSRMSKFVIKETIGAGYFATLNEPMLAGREFQERDAHSSADGSKTAPLPMVLSQSAARGLFGNENALGQRVMDDTKSYEVVGVIRDLKAGLMTDTSAVAYVPLMQRDFERPPAGGITIIVRSSAGPDALGSIRREIASIDPNLTIFNVRTVSDYLENTRSFMHLALNLYGGIGVFGLALAAIGLAGITAYAVAQRRKEIGIRLALGAGKAHVLRLVLREGAALVAVGTILGFLGARVMAKALSALINAFLESFKVAANDPLLLVGAPLLLATLALLACYLPARKSLKIDPLKVLREE